jgi:hypothetical protein
MRFRRNTMKSTILGALLLATTAFAGQGMQVPPMPKEFSKANFFLGKWTGTEKVHGMGGAPVNAKGTFTGKRALGDRYIQSLHVMDMGKQGKMDGMHLLSYDTFKKQFVAFWLDSSNPQVMEMSGNFNGNKLVMISKPTPIPGMPEPIVMRATWTKLSTTKVTFSLDMKQGDKWAPMIEGNYRKIG